MPAYAMTYNNLVTDIQQYLERTDTATVDRIPTFIGLAEQVIASQIKFLGNLTVQSSAMIASNPIIDKPARWHKTVSMNVTVAGKRYPVLLRKYEYLREYWPDPTQTGEPAYYADYDYQYWLIAPTPSQAKVLEILYYQQPPLLGPESQTNYLTEYAPYLLLYGALLEATPFLKNDERIGTWQAMYDRAAQGVNSEDLKRILDRAANRSEA